MACAALLGAAGCHSTAEPERPASSPRPLGSEPDGAFGSTGISRVTLRSQGLSFFVPDGSAWRRDSRFRQSWVARHAPTRSQLVVRAWFVGRPARAESCEGEARSFFSELPARESLSVVEDGARELSSGHRSRVTVGLETRASASGPSLGHALVFGARGRQCLMLAMTSPARGPAEALDRVTFLTRTVLGHLSLAGISSRVAGPAPR